MRIFERDVELSEGTSGDRVRHAEHAEQHVFVCERPIGGVVERVCQCQLQPRADAEAVRS